MFTIKFYSEDGCRQIIHQADSFTILRSPKMGDDTAEITIHRKNGDDFRVDVGSDVASRPEGWPPLFAKAIIENASGKTTEIIYSGPPRAIRAA